METTENAGARKARKPFEVTVVREFPDLGRYKVRLLKDPRKGGPPWLDVREYVVGANYQGFTRKGVRLSTREEVAALRRILDEAAGSMLAQAS